MLFQPVTAPLFVPASRPDRFMKAAMSGADAVLVDLEDAVAPALKDEGRANLPNALALSVPTIIRINAEGTDWHDADLVAVAALGFRLVCVPKVGSTELLDRLASRLGSGTSLIVQIETARGVANAASIAAHASVRQLAFGPADFFHDMGMPVSRDMSGHVMRTIAVASRSAGIAQPLDGPCFTVADPAALVAECADAISWGAGGKLCIHPSQAPKVLESFMPGADEVAWARRVVQADRDGSARVVDGRMIDAPVAARARAVLARVGSLPATAQNKDPQR
jgi:citrate lyase subunit beta/citryl-CoA lyase